MDTRVKPAYDAECAVTLGEPAYDAEHAYDAERAGCAVKPAYHERMLTSLPR